MHQIHSKLPLPRTNSERCRWKQSLFVHMKCINALRGKKKIEVLVIAAGTRSYRPAGKAHSVLNI